MMTRLRTSYALAMVTVAAVLQAVTFDQIRVFGSRIDLPLLLVVGIGFVTRPNEAAVLGFAAGLLVDLYQFGPFGLHALVLCVAAWALSVARIRMLEAGASFRSVQGAGAVSIVTALTWTVGGIFGESPPDGTEWLIQLALASLQGAVLVHPATRIASLLLDPEIGASQEAVSS